MVRCRTIKHKRYNHVSPTTTITNHNHHQPSPTSLQLDPHNHRPPQFVSVVLSCCPFRLRLGAVFLAMWDKSQAEDPRRQRDHPASRREKWAWVKVRVRETDQTLSVLQVISINAMPVFWQMFKIIQSIVAIAVEYLTVISSRARIGYWRST